MKIAPKVSPRLAKQTQHFAEKTHTYGIILLWNHKPPYKLVGDSDRMCYFGSVTVARDQNNSKNVFYSCSDHLTI